MTKHLNKTQLYLKAKGTFGGLNAALQFKSKTAQKKTKSCWIDVQSLKDKMCKSRPIRRKRAKLRIPPQTKALKSANFWKDPFLNINCGTTQMNPFRFAKI